MSAFEDAVLNLLAAHSGRIVSRDRVVNRAAGDPLEVQMLELPDEQALASYLSDQGRMELAGQHRRDVIVARTQVLRIDAAAPA